MLKSYEARNCLLVYEERINSHSIRFVWFLITPQQVWNGFLGWNISISKLTSLKKYSLRNSRTK